MSRNLTRVHLAASMLVLALVAMAASAAGAPPRVDTYRLKERVANASFYFFDDPSGCIQTQVEVGLAEVAQRSEPGRPQNPVAWGFVYVGRIDRCDGYRTVLSAFGSRDLQPGETEFGGSLASAHLDAAFEVFDAVTNAQLTATVDLTWTATGMTMHVQERASTFMPGFRYTWSHQGSSRLAVAAGSLLLDSAEILPGPSTYGAINNLRSGTLLFYRD